MVSVKGVALTLQDSRNVRSGMFRNKATAGTSVNRQQWLFRCTKVLIRSLLNVLNLGTKRREMLRQQKSVTV